MVAIILEENSHTRQVLVKMLSALGYDSVLGASHIDEVCFFINKNLNHVKLILSSSTFEDGPDFPLSRLVIQNRELDLTPMIYIQNEGHFYSQYRYPNPLSRIDDALTKPFILKDLKASIILAHQRRAQLRNMILIFGKSKLRENAIEAMYDCNESLHWKEVLSVDTFENFKETIGKCGFRIGGILIEPDCFSSQLLSWLRLFKRSPLGAETQIVFLSQAPALAHEVRPFCDLFIPDPQFTPLKHSDWKQLILNLSRRLVFSLRLKDLLSSARECIKNDRLVVAQQKVKEAFKVDPTRWELHELSGVLAEKQGLKDAAVKSFKNELLTQPFAPLPHLKLIQLTSGIEKKKIIENAAAYCPQHPQIQTLIQQHNQET